MAVLFFAAGFFWAAVSVAVLFFAAGFFWAAASVAVLSFAAGDSLAAASFALIREEERGGGMSPVVRSYLSRS